MNENLKVQSHHLERGAYLYIRQSSMRQVMENVESTKRQYALRGRAIGLGWRDDQIIVIDSDQGESGASASWREGAGFSEAFGVLDGHVLRSAIAVMDKAALMNGASIVDSLLQRIQHKAGVRRPADAPAHNVTGVDVDHGGNGDETRPGSDICEVGNPEHVRRRSMELAIGLIERACTDLSAIVVRTGLPWTTPSRPRSPINRCTVQRATSKPSRFICRHTLRTA